MSEVRLIDANALKLMKVAECAGHTIEYAAGWKRCVEYCKNDAPTVDAVPVRHGEWIRTDAFPHRIYCSVCYKTYVPNDRWQIWVDDELPKNYCPNCGAKMDGADGERR